jgi:hypothetical protein
MLRKNGTGRAMRPHHLPARLAGFRLDEADLPPGVSLEELSRFQQSLSIRILAWEGSRY